MVADHVMPRPSQFAIGKLKSFSYIELWYFTDEGCAEAQVSSRAQSDDAYGFTKVDNLVALKPVASVKASHNVIQDADLTWRQMNVRKNTMLRFMDLCDWPQKHVQSLAHFYFNIELEPMRSRPNGEKILIAYQARVRRQWHNDLSRGLGFNIAPINQKLLSTVAEEVWDMIKLEAIKKVSDIPSLFPSSFLTVLTPYSPPFNPSPRSTLAIITMPCHHATPTSLPRLMVCPALSGIPLMSCSTTAMPFKLLTTMPRQITDRHATSRLPYTSCQPCYKFLYTMPMPTSTFLVLFSLRS